MAPGPGTILGFSDLDKVVEVVFYVRFGKFGDLTSYQTTKIMYIGEY